MSGLISRALLLTTGLLVALLIVVAAARWLTAPGQVFATLDRTTQMTADGSTGTRIQLQLQYADGESPFWRSASLPINQRIGPVLAGRNRTVLARVSVVGANSQTMTVPLHIRASSRWYLHIAIGKRPTALEVPKGWVQGLVPLPLGNPGALSDTLWIRWAGGVPLPSIS